MQIAGVYPMTTIEKSLLIENAIGQIQDGNTIMIGGFGVPGTPFSLIDELVHQGQNRLTIIKNDANEQGMGVDRLLENGQVEKLITTHIGLNARAIKMMNEMAIEVEFCAQGIFAERIRAAGSGLYGLLTDIGLGTDLQQGKGTTVIDGRTLVIEKALGADFALIHANRADPFGNLTYAASARNFNPLMAMAADHTLVEAETVLALGDLKPEEIHTPGPFIDGIITLHELTENYGVIRR
jgi:acetate CoA/acetoacetate CoA-transferase alpha subunit